MANNRRLKCSAVTAVVVALLVLLAVLAVPASAVGNGEAGASGYTGWYRQTSGTKKPLYAVSAHGKNNAWVAGGEKIIGTADGGATWTIHDRQASTVSVVDAMNMWGISDGDVLFKTDNGGGTWTEIDSGTDADLQSLYAVDAQTVWAVGQSGAIQRTTNGGDTWVDKSMAGVDTDLKGVYAASASTAWAVGGTNGTIMKTTNGGAKWSVQSIPPDIYCISGVGSQTLWAGGYTRILKSGNGGQTWSEQDCAGCWNMGSVAAVDANTAWATADEGKILKTLDGGKTWYLQKTGTTAILWGICAVDRNTAWAVGNGGVILHTTDGGGYHTPPSISSITPNSGRAGSEVSIIGTDFGYPRDQSYVAFGSTDATEYTAWLDTRISVKVPAGVQGQVEVKVYTAGGASNPKSFTVITPTYYSYYFAEGCTREGFSEWLCLQNPGSKALEVTATYMLAGGAPVEETYTLEATSRTSINVNEDVGPGQDVSVMLLAEGEFYAERPIYFNYKMGQPGFSWTGGHCATGAVSPGSDWYFAEGTTREGFEEWICIQNPNNKDVNVKVFYVSAGAYMQQKEYNVPARSRVSVFVNGDVGPDQDVSVHVHCDDSIVAERPMYFNYHSKWDGGHVVMGTDCPKNLWYFAEGSTGPGFEEWLAVQNTNDADAHITVHFFKGDGTQQNESYTVGANSRWTLDVSVPLGEGVDSSMTIESDQPVVAERPMYFNYNGWTGGHDVLGSSTDKTSWFFAEGCTRDGFDEYICVGNPGGEKTHVTITFMLGTGEQITQELDIGARARATVNVANVIGRGHDVSARVEADKPVVAERPMYFNYNGWTGGHDVVGF